MNSDTGKDAFKGNDLGRKITCFLGIHLRRWHVNVHVLNIKKIIVVYYVLINTC